MPTRLVLSAAILLLAAACGEGGGGITPTPETGTITGQVTGRGGGVPNATVSLEGGGSQTTDGQGRFTFSNVTAGTRNLAISPPTGFALDAGETPAKSVAVTTGGTATVNWSVRLGDTTPRTAEINLTASTFDPRDVVLPQGSTVNWTNGTPITHTITPNQPNQAGAWQETTISGTGTVFSHTFASTGTYEYVCTLHAGMAGVVRVH